MTNQVERSQMMGPWLTTALVVGTMVGSGIFMLPVSLAPLGPNALVGWVVSIAGALSIAFAFALLSRAGGGGGIQSYIEQAFGPLIAFLTTWAFWFSNWTAVAAVAIAFGAATSRISPLFGNDTVVILAVGSLAFLTVVNAFGVRVSGGLNLATIAIILPGVFQHYAQRYRGSLTIRTRQRRTKFRTSFLDDCTVGRKPHIPFANQAKL